VRYDQPLFLALRVFTLLSLKTGTSSHIWVVHVEKNLCKTNFFRQTTCDRKTALCTVVHRAVLRSHVVCPSVTLVDCDHIGWNSSKNNFTVIPVHTTVCCNNLTTNSVHRHTSYKRLAGYYTISLYFKWKNYHYCDLRFTQKQLNKSPSVTQDYHGSMLNIIEIDILSPIMSVAAVHLCTGINWWAVKWHHKGQYVYQIHKGQFLKRTANRKDCFFVMQNWIFGCQYTLVAAKYSVFAWQWLDRGINLSI